MSDAGENELEGVPVHWGNFLDTPPAESDPAAAQVFIIPVPYDGTASYRGGARDGPRAIIEASRHLEDYDLELDRDVSLVGVHTMPEIAPDLTSPESMVEHVRRVVLSVASQGKLVGLLGGEHTISIGSVQALTQVYPELSVLYLDAHADLRDRYMGTRWGHASVARRLRDICSLVQVGVRSVSEEEMRFIREVQLPVFFRGSATAEASVLARDVLGHLSERVYVSVDLDVFDPSIMSAVGTPEPGGMTWDEVIGLIKAVGEQREIVGFDVTELAPGEGPEACAFTAAKLAYKLIGYATSP
jgi:agmatinase